MASVDAAGVSNSPAPVIHPRWVRVTHWINALAMVVMIASGWEIYNASPLFDFRFPKSITLGGWLAGALLWHFAAMWLLAVNGLVYVALGLFTGRFRRMLWPIRPRDVVADTKAALAFRLAHDNLAVYNSVQRLLYAGGYEASRYVHFFAMAAIVGFLVIHVVLAVLVPKSLRAMIAGR